MSLLRPRLFAAVVLALMVAACNQASLPNEPAGGLAPQFGASGDDSATQVATDAARGRIYLAGVYETDPTTGMSSRVFFRRYDRDGRFVWERRINSRGYVTGVATDRDGNAYFSWNSDKGFITKYNPAGTRLFQLVLRGVIVDGFTTDAANNFYVGGRPATSTFPPFIRKYSSTGQLIWERQLRIFPAGNDFGPPVTGVADIAATPDGSLYLAGASVDDYGYLVKLRSRDGSVVGSQQIFGSGAEIAVSGNDIIYLLATYEDVIDCCADGRLYRFRADLSVAWVRDELIPSESGGGERENDDDIFGLGSDPQGNAYLTGFYFTEATNDADYFVRKYAPAGDLLFDQRVTVATSDAQGSGIAALSADELYVVGSTNGKVNGTNYGGADAFLVRTDGRGVRVWSR